MIQVNYQEYYRIKRLNKSEIKGWAKQIDFNRLYIDSPTGLDKQHSETNHATCCSKTDLKQFSSLL